MTDKPTALRLADSIEAAVEVGRYSVGGVADCAAAELRRLHAENEKFREAAQQALEALTVYDGTNGESKRKRVLAALRAALAEPQDEPVAWMYPDDYERMVSSEAWAEVFSVQVSSPTQGKTTVPLYTHPAPQRQPLSDEKLRGLWSWAMTAEAERTAATQQHAFARAIERAHGIGGQDDQGV